MTATAVTPDEAIEWAQTTFKPFNLAWQVSAPLEQTPGTHVRGTSQGAVIDCVLKDKHVRLISMVVRLAPESTILMVHTLATVHRTAERKDADQWLSRFLKSLNRKRPDRKTRQWGDWSVEIATTALGVCTMIIKPKRRV